MNKVGKRFLSACLALSVICGIGGISVFAASSASGSINGYDTSGVSSIWYTGASAYTSFETNGDVSVRSTYTYINYNTLDEDDTYQSEGHYNYADVGFVAPSNCRSKKINSYHRVSAFSQTWTANTSATYP